MTKSSKKSRTAKSSEQQQAASQTVTTRDAPARANSSPNPGERAQPDPTTPKLQRVSKQSHVVDLLKTPGGATIDELVAATGWQRHSVRGIISGTLKKKLGLLVESQAEARGRVYRIVTAASSVGQ